MNKSCSVWLLAVLALLGWSGITPIRALRQSGATTVDVDKLGPMVSEIVPDFSLPDQHGATRSLKSLMGPKGAIVVFLRSADW